MVAFSAPILNLFGSGKKPEEGRQVTREYRQFKKEEKYVDQKGFDLFYVRACQKIGGLMRIRPPKGLEEKLYNAALIADLPITPSQVLGFTFFTTIFLFLLFIPIALGPGGSVLVLTLPFLIAYYTLTYPFFVAEVTKIRASDESIKVILYMVIYLRLNPNFEGAISFAARHTSGPFGKDLKKLLWDLEMGKFQTISDAFSSRVRKWIEWDKDFLESFQTLMGITIVVSDEKRKRLLNDGLDLILDRTYEKMKDYGKALRTPTLFIHTLGISLPIMGLIMFPMVSVFLAPDPEKGGGVNPWSIVIGYDLILPTFLFWYTRRVISKRPGAYAYPDISHHPELPPEGRLMIKRKDKRPLLLPIWPISLLILVIFAGGGIGYLLNVALDYMQYCTGPGNDCNRIDLDSTRSWKNRIILEFDPTPCFDPKTGENVLYESVPCIAVSPAFTIILLSMSVTWGIGFALGFHFLASSFQRVRIRKQIKELESEFIVGLNRLGDVLETNMPIETSIEVVSKKYKLYGYRSSPMYEFFITILRRMRDFGMTFEGAIFDKEFGIIKKYPSKLVEDIMKVLVTSSKRGPAIVALVTKSVSEFLSKTRSVEILINDILDEIVSNAKLQVSFIAPFVTGIVSATAVLLVQLLRTIIDAIDRITKYLGEGTANPSDPGLGETMLGNIRLESLIPPSVFQLVIGIYMIEVIILLSFFLNGLQNGFDKNTRNYMMGKYLLMGTLFYSIIVLVGIFMFADVICSVAQGCKQD
ncbi:MAG: hypothetical protein HYX24_00535 [Candidatus Aenigmarchaeota archaeon]|nr:hypothetical protein [Candidatus Aenigmarchaeota archaeon]